MTKNTPIIAILEHAIENEDTQLLEDIATALAKVMTPAIAKRAAQALDDILIVHILEGDLNANDRCKKLDELQAEYVKA